MCRALLRIHMSCDRPGTETIDQPSVEFPPDTAVPLRGGRTFCPWASRASGASPPKHTNIVGGRSKLHEREIRPTSVCAITYLGPTVADHEYGNLIAFGDLDRDAFPFLGITIHVIYISKCICHLGAVRMEGK